MHVSRSSASKASARPTTSVASVDKHATFRDAIAASAAASATRFRQRFDGAAARRTTPSGRCATPFDVNRGEVLGLVGRNGAGKSTLLKVLSRITEPTEGRAVLRGRVASLLEVGTGFHPELTGRENIYLNGAILGMTQAEIDAQVRRDRRVQRGREVPRHAGQALQLAACTCGWRSRWRRTWSRRS